MAIHWYMKNKAENIENNDQYRDDHKWRIPYLFYNGTKWKQDDAYLNQAEYGNIEKAGEKFGNQVWRS